MLRAAALSRPQRQAGRQHCRWVRAAVDAPAAGGRQRRQREAGAAAVGSLGRIQVEEPMKTSLPFELGRRHFLKGLGGFGLAIPFLESLSNRALAQSVEPNNLVAVRWANGVYHDHYY